MPVYYYCCAAAATYTTPSKGANATITADFSLLNATGKSFAVRDVWSSADVGVHTGSYSSTVMPQAVTYLILTPSSLL